MAAEYSPDNDPIQTYQRLHEHEDNDGQPIATAIDRSVKAIGHVVMWANILLVAAIVSQILLRYLLNQHYPKLDEIQWHFYGLVTMIGMSYALVTDSHVRVDLFHMQLSRRAQRLIEVAGILTLLVPFIYLMIDQGYDYFHESWRVGERSSSAIGLPARWALKAVIPISFVLLALAALARLIHDVHALLRGPASEREGASPRRLILLLFGFAVVCVALTFPVETTEEKLVITMVLTFIALLFTGYPVAWPLAVIGVAFCGLAYLFDNGFMLWTGLEDTFTGLDYLTLGAEASCPRRGLVCAWTVLATISIWSGVKSGRFSSQVFLRPPASVRGCQMCARLFSRTCFSLRNSGGAQIPN